MCGRQLKRKRFSVAILPIGKTSKFVAIIFMTKIKTLSVLVLLCLCSCVSYKHSWTNTDGSIDETRFGSFLMMGSASKVRSATKMGTNYNRTVSIGAIEGRGDTEFISAVTAGVAAGLAAGLKSGAGVP